MKTRKITLFLLFLAVLSSAFGQKNKLLQSRTTSALTYIYEITDKEALKLLKTKPKSIDTAYFHTLADTYPTDSVYKKPLAQGKHYLKTYSSGNKQLTEYTYVPAFDVMILDNNTDLCLQIYDLQGKNVSDATVKIGCKKLKFDKKTQCYVERKSNRKGVLSVTQNGNTAYYDLSKTNNYDPFRKTMTGIFYRSPLKYVWLPVSYTVSLPADLINTARYSLKRSYWQPYGAIYRIENFFKRLFNPDDYYQPKRQDYQGYMVFNKPKYKPNDTVKFKAFVVDKKGKPVKKELKVVLSGYRNYRKTKTLTTLKPYRAGAFEYSFPLHDSLELKLDDNYTVSLRDTRDKEGEDYIGSRFFYEEYELNNTKLTVNTSSDKQFRGKTFRFFAKGTDENDLNLMDARLEICAVTKSAFDYQQDKMTVPDTLWKYNRNLEPTGETEITVPDTIFPKANIKYDLSVKMLTSDNKSFTQTKSVTFYYLLNETRFSLVKDSIRIETYKNNEPTAETITLTASDNFNNKTAFGTFKTPAQVPLNVYYATYTAKNGENETAFDVSAQSPLLQSYTTRTMDSVLIDITNPRNLRFTYHIYEQNTEKFRGNAEKLAIHNKVSTPKNYYLTLNYLWGGEIKSETYRIPLMDKRLNIEVKQSRIIYPGQKTNVDILVTDMAGKPVENVDLTAFSMTKKFNYSAPEVPYLGKKMPEKELINNFRINKQKPFSASQNLNYNEWKKSAGLDSIEYYRFIYPESNIYKTEYAVSDGKTQFAPFVLTKEGEFEKIHIVAIDNEPVYFGWNTTLEPYSFTVEDGYHRVEIRTSTKKIIVPKMYFKPGMKTIFSLNDDELAKKETYNVQKVENKLTQQEKNWVNPYIFPYRNNFGENFTYLESVGKISLLNPSMSNNYYRNYTSPIIRGTATLNVVDKYKIDFVTERYFEYDFSDKLLKMREVKPEDLPSNKYLSSQNPVINLTDTILTRSIIENQYKLFLKKKRQEKIVYNNPTQTETGFGKIFIENAFPKDKTAFELPLNVVLLKKDDMDFIRIYQGNVSYLHQLEEGSYKVFFYYTDSYYSEYQIDVKKNALNYLRINYPAQLKKDEYSKVIDTYIENNIRRYEGVSYFPKIELNSIRNQFLQQNTYRGEGYMISGRVVDDRNEPIIGATIAVKGTAYGAVTNMEGVFNLKIPSDKVTILVSFIGHETKEINILSNANLNNIVLKEDEKMLEEVVVVGYGVQKRMSFTGSLVVTNALEGSLAGLSFNGGASADIRLRGIASVNSNAQPLYIIDGQVFTGDVNSLNSSDIENVEVLKDASATAMYGARGANGVVLISTKNKKFASSSLNKGADFDEAFAQAAASANNLRSNFSDYAFWQPRLTTDKHGKATFETTFPDDVTNWQTYVLAMNDKRQSGQASAQTKSYKPLMAQLAVPNFLVKSDEVSVIGKSLNYLPDTLNVTNTFEVNGKNIFTKTRKITNSLIDSLQLKAEQDSVSLLYSLKKDDGYFDGEKRDIPVFPIGLEETKGSFYILENDTVITPEFDKNLRKVQLYADVDEVEFLKGDLAKVINYKYWCNEQIASKLKALLADKLICQYKGTAFKKEGEINKLIRLLLKNRRKDDLWGWWETSAVHLPFSVHILEALQSAKNQHYDVNVDLDDLAKKAVARLAFEHNPQSIRLLKVLKSLNATVDYEKYIQHFDSVKNADFSDKLNLMELKQMCGARIQLDSLYKYKQTTMFGSVYFKNSDSKTRSYYCNDDIINSLTAYRVLRNANPQDAHLSKIRKFIFETKKNHTYWNTYETAQIAETLLPDMLKQNKKFEKATLKIEGTVTKSVDKFPYELTLTADDRVKIAKTGNEPMYLTVYQRYWNENPAPKSGDFVIETRFEHNSNLLEQGKNVKLIVRLEAVKDADYVMVNIPIPAGCSYAEKHQYYRNEVHREYFKNETAIFCEKLKKGNYTFEISLTPRFSGVYTLNPAKAELMYFPTFNANNGIKKVSIK